MIMTDPSVINPFKAAVFCTSLVDSDPRRYQAWIDYYTRFFAGENVDLYLYNDGPASTPLDLKGARLVTFSEPLGRQADWIFPGWKRSFSTAVSELGARYAFLAHVESDTIILEPGRDMFLRALRSHGYCTGYTARYKFVETAIQILNTDRSRRFFVERYKERASLYREERFEKIVQYTLRPGLILHGERMEDQEVDLDGNYTYLSQMPIYRFYERYPEGAIPWNPAPPTALWLHRIRIASLRVQWTVGYLEKIARNRLR